MASIKLNLLTISSTDLDRAVIFYRALGLNFSKHAHGTGPEHYCSEDAGVVFEIYPLQPGKTPTTDTRLGFAVDSVDSVFARVTADGAGVVSAPRESPWGRRAVVTDFDGHRVELTSSNSFETRRNEEPGDKEPRTEEPRTERYSAK